MEASAWHGSNGAFGVYVGKQNRDQHFNPSWNEIEVEIDGEKHRFKITPGFWRKCPEFRDSRDKVIRNWLQKYHTLKWPKGQPPHFQLLPLGNTRFRLTR